MVPNFTLFINIIYQWIRVDTVQRNNINDEEAHCVTSKFITDLGFWIRYPFSAYNPVI